MGGITASASAEKNTGRAWSGKTGASGGDAVLPGNPEPAVDRRRIFNPAATRRGVRVVCWLICFFVCALFGLASIQAAGAAEAVASGEAAVAGDKEPVILRLSHIYAPDNLWGESAQRFADAVAARTGNRVRIEINSVRIDWPAALEGLRTGQNDIVLQSVGTLDRYHIIAAIESYPYLIRDLEHFRRVYEGPVGRALFDEITARTGFRIIGAGYRGARHLTANRKVERLEDLQGLKLRVPPLKMYKTTWDILGATTVPFGITELYLALEQGLVDGQENPMEGVLQFRLNEVQKYLIETGHILGAMTWIFDERRFLSLPAETRNILITEGEKAMQAATEKMVRQEENFRKELQNKGMIFISVDRNRFRERLVPMLREFPELAEWVRRIQGL